MFFAICANDHAMQKRVQQEIDEVLGDSLPTFADREKLPIVDSMVIETLRYLTQTPLGIPHKTTENVQLNGYMIPKNTEVYIIYSL